MAAMRAEALAATPFEVARLREAREAQRVTLGDLSGGGDQEREALGRAAWCRRVWDRGRWRSQAVDDEVWLDSGWHSKAWRFARLCRLWVWRFRRRRDAALLALREAALTREEMGDGLADEVEAAVAAERRHAARHRECMRRGWVLVCGLFYKLQPQARAAQRQAARKARQARSQAAKKDKAERRRELARQDSVGAARAEEIRTALHDAEVAERGARGLHPLLEISVLGSYHPVPAWSYRPLGAGEWREGVREGGELLLPPPKRRRLGGESRKRALAEAAGTVDYLEGARPGRMRAVRQRRGVPSYCEEGMDVSGVT